MYYCSSQNLKFDKDLALVTKVSM